MTSLPLGLVIEHCPQPVIMIVKDNARCGIKVTAGQARYGKWYFDFRIVRDSFGAVK